MKIHTFKKLLYSNLKHLAIHIHIKNPGKMFSRDIFDGKNSICFATEYQ